MERSRTIHRPWRSVLRLIRFTRLSQPTHPLPAWCPWSVMANLAGAGVLLGLLIHAQIQPPLIADGAASAIAGEGLSEVPYPEQFATLLSTAPDAPLSLSATPLASHSPQVGSRHRLDYQDWLVLLEQEAIAVSQRSPENLTVLMGDSISLWFPPDLLPHERSWLNQGISGEVSSGLLKRLDLIKPTQPDSILILIGINDLIRAVEPATILANHELILQQLKAQHPQARLVVQSILPHAGEGATWEGAARLQEIPNAQIRDINRSLEAIAQKHDAQYLDLNPLFAGADGDLRPELTTDGLHLSPNGYLVWATALQVYLAED
ncbi:MAG: GDSL-type esterase/lipase family protein [Elainellaceae cyanobacterium]